MKKIFYPTPHRGESRELLKLGREPSQRLTEMIHDQNNLNYIKKYDILTYCSYVRKKKKPQMVLYLNALALFHIGDKCLANCMVLSGMELITGKSDYYKDFHNLNVSTKLSSEVNIMIKQIFLKTSLIGGQYQFGRGGTLTDRLKRLGLWGTIIWALCSRLNTCT